MRRRRTSRPVVRERRQRANQGAAQRPAGAKSGSKVGHARKKNDTVIPISAREALLRRKVRRQLRSLGFHRSGDGALEINGHDKDLVRSLHGPQRTDRLSANSDFLARRADKATPLFRLWKGRGPRFHLAQARAGVRRNLAGGFVSPGCPNLVRAGLQWVRSASSLRRLGCTQRQALGLDRHWRSRLQSIGPRHAHRVEC